MTADDVIESYVRAVAACLPRARRNDVAFELRALLADELAAKAQSEGRAPDRAMAMALLQGFGRPAEAARRYHERPPPIDPADSHHLTVWAVAGVVVIGVLMALDREGGTVDGDLILEWLGLLLIVFVIRAWWRRRNPGVLGWKPSGDPDRASRVGAAVAAVATVIFPLFMYAAPVTFAETMFLGHIATSGLALDETFAASWQRMATLAVLAMQAAMWTWMTISGRWQAWSRRASIAINLLLGVAFLAHSAPFTTLDGASFPVFALPAANTTAWPIFTLVGALCLLSGLYELYREWARIDPAPAMKRGPSRPAGAAR